MKNIFLILIFLFCGAILLLATVDLTPYLTPAESVMPVETQVKDAQQVVTKGVDTTTPVPVTPQKSIVVISPTKIELNVSGQQTESVSQKAVASESSIQQTIPKPVSQPKLDSTPPPTDTPQATMAQVTPPTPARDKQERPAFALHPDCLQLNPGEYPFSILLETFDARETAVNAIPLFKKRGVDSYWVKVDLGSKGIKYRLFTGAFADQKSAELYARKKGLKDKPVKKTRYSVLLDTANRSEKVKINSLRKAVANTEAMPYLLCTEARHYLYVGAFYTMAGARTQCDKLAAAGLSCQPMIRSVPAAAP